MLPNQHQPRSCCIYPEYCILSIKRNKRDPMSDKIKVSKPYKITTKGSHMDILNTKSLKYNKQIKINFNGGDLSSDAGLLLIKEFATKIGFVGLVKKIFKPQTRHSASTGMTKTSCK